MRPQSCKAKGRRLQQEIRDAVLAAFPKLQPGDVRSTSMGASGEDILLSPAALQVFPFYVEAKNRESINIWAAIEQATTGARKEDIVPLVVFRRNNVEAQASLPFSALLEILKDAAAYNDMRNDVLKVLDAD